MPKFIKQRKAYTQLIMFNLNAFIINNGGGLNIEETDICLKITANKQSITKKGD